jgi:hypothetical protein
VGGGVVARPLQSWRHVRVPQLLLVAGLVTGCDTSLLTGSDCTTSVDKTIDVESPALPPVQLKIESCRVDIDACGALCTRVMADNSLGGGGPISDVGLPPGGAPSGAFVPYTKCEVTFEGATTHVAVAYDQFNGGANCPVFTGVP